MRVAICRLASDEALLVTVKSLDLSASMPAFNEVTARCLQHRPPEVAVPAFPLPFTQAFPELDGIHDEERLMGPIKVVVWVSVFVFVFGFVFDFVFGIVFVFVFVHIWLFLLLVLY